MPSEPVESGRVMPEAPRVDSVITVRWDTDRGCVVFDLDGLDDWSAVTMLQQVVDAVEDRMPWAVDINEEGDEED